MCTYRFLCRYKHLILLSLGLSACGQPGPLYLPGTTPPFYVPPPAEKEIEKPEQPAQKKADKPEKPKSSASEQEIAPQPEQEQLDKPPTQQ